MHCHLRIFLNQSLLNVVRGVLGQCGRMEIAEARMESLIILLIGVCMCICGCVGVCMHACMDRYVYAWKVAHTGLSGQR